MKYTHFFPIHVEYQWALLENQISIRSYVWWHWRHFHLIKPNVTSKFTEFSFLKSLNKMTSNISNQYNVDFNYLLH